MKVFAHNFLNHNNIPNTPNDRELIEEIFYTWIRGVTQDASSHRS